MKAPLWISLLATWAVLAAAAPADTDVQAILKTEEDAQAIISATISSTRTLAYTINGTLISGQSLSQEEVLYSRDGAVYIVAQSDGNFVLYNAALVALYGESSYTAIFASGTYTSSPIQPYSLYMQEDCNLVMYNGNALIDGYNAATAVYESGTYGWAAYAPCQLVVTSAGGGSIYIVDSHGKVIYQRPATFGLTPPGAPPITPTPPGFLYAFNGMTFSTCGVMGALGPVDTSVCAATYLPYGTWITNPTYMHVNNGIQTWVAPANATYSIEAAGAGGGAATFPGGLGAAISGNLMLTAGTTLYILVGQAGTPSTYAGGGGGATYIFISSLTTPLLVAGGGGGGTATASGGPGGTMNDTAPPVGGPGGPPHPEPSNMDDAAAGSSGQPGMGGSGGSVTSDAVGNGGGGGGGGAVGNATSSYSGGSGGADTGGQYPGFDGGFGGGGGSGAGNGTTSAGGGGGWSGGQGGFDGASNNFTALGGTSYASGALFATPPVIGHSPIQGPGFVIIEIVQM